MHRTNAAVVKESEDAYHNDALRIQENYKMLDTIEKRLKGYLGTTIQTQDHSRPSDRLSLDTEQFSQPSNPGGSTPCDIRSTKIPHLDYASPPTKEKGGFCSTQPAPLVLNAPDYSFKKASKENLKATQFFNDIKNPITQSAGQDSLTEKIKAIDAKINRFKRENQSFGHVIIAPSEISAVNSGRSSNIEMAIKSQIAALTSVNSQDGSISRCRLKRDASIASAEDVRPLLAANISPNRISYKS